MVGRVDNRSVTGNIRHTRVAFGAPSPETQPGPTGTAWLDSRYVTRYGNRMIVSLATKD